jgi:predicted amidohydrolase YtcJ
MTTLFANGLILGGSAYPVWHRAMLVDGGRITMVGGEEALAEHAADADRVDLGGSTVLPGFIDAHVHPIEGGQELISCALSEGVTIDDYRRLIAAWAGENPGPEWIIGQGWSMDAFPDGIPSASDLGGIDGVNGRPVFLMNRDGHSAWVNHEALRRAGIADATPDPAGGRIERGADGVAVGALHELAADLVRAVVPAAELPSNEAALRKAQEYLTALGITSWQDAGIRTDRGYDRAYRTLVDDGSLMVEVEGAQWLPSDFGPGVVDDMVALRDEFAGTKATMSTVKIMLDGVIETHTAHLKSPYLTAACSHDTGISFFEPEALNEVAAQLDALGFNLHFHAVGDAALRQAIDTVEHCRTVNGWSTMGVHHVAHVQVVDHADLVDMRRVGLGVNAQTLWARLEPYVSELAIPVLGDERGYAQYPFASFLQRGIALGLGSDWSVSTPRPFHQLHVAVNRRPVPKPTVAPDVAVFMPEERLTLLDAVRAFTIGSAYLCGRADRKGSLEPGKDADFVVLDRDVFAGDPRDIYQTEVEETWIAGRRVHATSAAPGGKDED